MPLILLWVAAVALIGGGFWLLTSSNADQIDLYSTGSQDVAALLGAQTATTIAGLLLAVGALAVVIALAVHALAHVSARAAATTTATDAAAFAAEENAVFDEAHSGDDATVAPIVPAPAAAVPAKPAAPAEPAAPAAPATETDPK
ncbi:hypothetical protein DCE94_05145 [Agromyces badenianii]|nr:hypothetical protein DCE94_05145 [Agromyces badenianii]